MAQQSFMWTVLPNGYTTDGKSLRLSVLLSPRLEPQTDPEKLASFFPDWENLPRTLMNATFEFRYGDRTVTVSANLTTGANRVDHQIGSLEPSVWNALFNGEIFVRNFEYKDLADNYILSFDTVHVHSIVQNLYRGLARNANGHLPLVSDFIDDPDWRRLTSTVTDLDSEYSDHATGLRDPKRQFSAFKENKMSVDKDKLAESLGRFQLYHTPPASHSTDFTHTHRRFANKCSMARIRSP